MGQMSNYLEESLLNHTILRTAFTVPSNYYVGLSAGAPGEDGTISGEPAGGSYARINHNSWTRNSTDRHVQNNGVIDFGTATGAWGTITHWFISDASSGGNLLVYGAFKNGPFAVDNTDTFSIPNGQLTVDIDEGGMSTFYANELLESVFGIDGLYTPPEVWIALGDTLITDTDDGTGAWELANTGNYARIQKEGTGNWSAASAGQTKNSNTFAFAQANAAWATVRSCALVTNGTYGNGEILVYGTINNINIGENDTARFLAMNLTLDFS